MNIANPTKDHRVYVEMSRIMSETFPGLEFSPDYCEEATNLFTTYFRNNNHVVQGIAENLKIRYYDFNDERRNFHSSSWGLIVSPMKFENLFCFVGSFYHKKSSRSAKKMIVPGTFISFVRDDIVHALDVKSMLQMFNIARMLQMFNIARNYAPSPPEGLSHDEQCFIKAVYKMNTISIRCAKNIEGNDFSESIREAMSNLSLLSKQEVEYQMQLIEQYSKYIAEKTALYEKAWVETHELEQISQKLLNI
jgi:hypothetical protein